MEDVHIYKIILMGCNGLYIIKPYLYKKTKRHFFTKSLLSKQYCVKTHFAKYFSHHFGTEDQLGVYEGVRHEDSKMSLGYEETPPINPNCIGQTSPRPQHGCTLYTPFTHSPTLMVKGLG